MNCPFGWGRSSRFICLIAMPSLFFFFFKYYICILNFFHTLSLNVLFSLYFLINCLYGDFIHLQMHARIPPFINHFSVNWFVFLFSFTCQAFLSLFIVYLSTDRMQKCLFCQKNILISLRLFCPHILNIYFWFHTRIHTLTNNTRYTLNTLTLTRQ